MDASDEAHRRPAHLRGGGRDTPLSGLPAAEAGAARLALGRIPGFGPAARAAAFTRLQGLTNRVYRVDLGGESYCLRIPGAGTGAIIDRGAEAANARAAAAAGIAPEVLYFGADGLMLTPFIEGAITLSSRAFRGRPGAVERAAHALCRLHRETRAFVGEFHSYAIIRRYFALLQSRGVKLDEIVPELLREAEEIQRALDARPVAPRPCHCDPTGANLLDTGERIWLIDWEYSGMNDPMWDLAYLSIQSEFDAELDSALLAAYLGRPPQRPETSRMAVHKALVELLSALWALVQHSGGNAVADFRTYAAATLDRCRSRMRSPTFAAHLETLRRG